MGPLRDGWVLIYEHTEKPMTEILIDQLCIVRTGDGRTLVRYPRKARKVGAWDLLTVTGPPELDVQVEWAEAVTMIVPHRPSPELNAALEAAES